MYFPSTFVPNKYKRRKVGKKNAIRVEQMKNMKNYPVTKRGIPVA